MSKTKHTPGPWIIQRYVGSDAFQIHAWGMATNKWQPMQLPVAWIPNAWYRGDSKLHNELEANARLIAAAPDLLEALQTVVANAPEPYCAITSAVDAQCRAAIAKATGEQK